MKKIFAVKEIPKLTWSSPSAFNLRPKVKTLFYLVLGLILFGLGESLLIASSAGVSPWTVLAQGIASKTGWSIGFATVVISGVILILWWPLKQRFGLGTVLNALIIAFMIEFSLVLLPYPETYIWQITQVIVGVMLIGLATGIYLTANLGAGPRDGLMTGLQKLTGKPIANVRIAIEMTVVAIGWYLGGVVGAGTLIFAFGIGPSVAIGILLVKKFF